MRACELFLSVIADIVSVFKCFTESGNSRFVYDGHNRRVKIQKDNGKVEYSFYNQAGQLLYRETDRGPTNYIFLGKKLVAKEGAGAQSSQSVMHYKPFGESIETPKDDVGYTGHKFDKDLGLSYMQARYYDPMIGRFMSNDPVGFSNIHNFNRYTYANNNPYKYVDPDGKQSVLGIYSQSVNEQVVQGKITPEEAKMYVTAASEGAGMGPVIGPSGVALGYNVVSRLAKLGSLLNRGASFANRSKLVRHFNTHGGEFGAKSAREYLSIARGVMKSGYKVIYKYKGEMRTGFVKFMGSSKKGKAKFAFVGTNAKGKITTLHTKSGKDVWKTLNGNASNKTIYRICGAGRKCE